MTDLAAPPTVTARRLLADLEAAGVDPAVVALVRHGLGAIAGEVRELPRGIPQVSGSIGLREVLELIEPGERA